MAVRDLLGTVFSTKEDEPVLAALEVLRRGGDEATALQVRVLPYQTYLYESAMSTELWAEVMTRAHETFAIDAAALNKRCELAEPPIRVQNLFVTPPSASFDVAVVARHSDLTIMLRPQGSELADDRRAVFEGALFGSGRPVLLVPPKWKKAPIGRKIMVGWNAKREAVRALADAASLFPEAELVSVVTVDAKPSLEGHGAHPGADICTHLARKGMNTELRNLDGLGRDEGEVILAEARALQADLLVIGGYGNARMREFLFGGVTRALIGMADLPVLLSH